MSPRFVVTGTDTDVGKTVFAAALAGALNACYYKPVQAGLQEIDSETVRHLAQIPSRRIVPERYRLRTPASPHLAAERDGVIIDPDSLDPPVLDGPLIIEGAGGLMVPLIRDFLMIDLFARWKIPAILCARTTLGTINHTLLSIEALRARHIPMRGIAFIGEENTESQRIIADMSRVHVLGRLPRLSPLNPQTLREAFARQFDIQDFAA
jgi:dethiobiotin synthetase